MHAEKKVTFSENDDPLLPLAISLKNGENLTYLDAGQAKVDDLKLAAFVSFGSSKAPYALEQAVFENKYTLKSVIFCVKNANLGQMQYFRKSLAEKIPALPNKDKESLLKRIETLKQNSDTLEATSAFNNAKTLRKRSGDSVESPDGAPTKKRIATVAVTIEESEWAKRYSRCERRVDSYCAMLHTRNLRLKSQIAYIAAAWNKRIRINELEKVQGALQRHTSAVKTGFQAVSQNPQSDNGGIAAAMSTFAAVGAGDTSLSNSLRDSLAVPSAKGEGNATARFSQGISRAPLPTIIVPATPKALVNPYNAKLFFEGRKFDLKTTEQYMASGEALPSLADVVIHRKLDRGRTRAYRVNFMPQQLTDWKSVVAVFASGEPWQFEQHYRWKDPAILFSNTCGFHLKDFRSPTAPYINHLNVHILELHTGITKHQNPAMLKKKFWETLDKWMTSRGRPLD